MQKETFLFSVHLEVHQSFFSVLFPYLTAALKKRGGEGSRLVLATKSPATDHTDQLTFYETMSEVQCRVISKLPTFQVVFILTNCPVGKMY